MSEPFDDQARRMGALMGEALEAQITNAEYHIERDTGIVTRDDLGYRLMLRARELRAADAAALEDHRG